MSYNRDSDEVFGKSLRVYGDGMTNQVKVDREDLESIMQLCRESCIPPNVRTDALLDRLCAALQQPAESNALTGADRIKREQVSQWLPNFDYVCRACGERGFRSYHAAAKHVCQKPVEAAQPDNIGLFIGDVDALVDAGEKLSIRQQLRAFVPPLNEWPDGATLYAFDSSGYGYPHGSNAISKEKGWFSYAIYIGPSSRRLPEHLRPHWRESLFTREEMQT